MDIDVTIEPADNIDVEVAPPATINVEIENGRPGIPAGGTTGQVLKKNTASDYDVSWQADSGGGGGSSAWGDITGTLSNQTDLQNALNAKANSSDVTTGLAGKSNLGHTHAIADTTGLQTALNGKAASTHTHVIADTTGLQAALDAKAAASHTHTAANVTDFATAVDARIQNVIGTAPAALDTLGELADALNDDANFAGTVTTQLAGKSNVGHAHAIADTTGLQTALDGKASSIHTHDVDDLNTTGTASGTTFLRGDGVWATPPAGSGGANPTFEDDFNRANQSPMGVSTSGRTWSGVGWQVIGNQAGPNTGSYTLAIIDTGTAYGQFEITLPTAGTEQWVIFRYVDGNNYFRFGTSPSNTNYRLQRIDNNNVVAVGNGVTNAEIAPANGDVIRIQTDPDDSIHIWVNDVLCASAGDPADQDVPWWGLAAADATVRFENMKQYGVYVATTVEIEDVNGLQTALDGKSATGHTHTASQVTDFNSAVDARIANVVDGAPAALDTLNELAAALGDDANFASTVTTQLAGKAATTHTHVIADTTGLQTALDGKAASSHTHTIGNVTGLQTALDGKTAINYRYWNGSGGVGSWDARPTGLPAGRHVDAYSLLDADAPPPPGAQAGDVWFRHPDAV